MVRAVLGLAKQRLCDNEKSKDEEGVVMAHDSREKAMRVHYETLAGRVARKRDRAEKAQEKRKQQSASELKSKI